MKYQWKEDETSALLALCFYVPNQKYFFYYLIKRKLLKKCMGWRKFIIFNSMWNTLIKCKAKVADNIFLVSSFYLCISKSPYYLIFVPYLIVLSNSVVFESVCAHTWLFIIDFNSWIVTNPLPVSLWEPHRNGNLYKIGYLLK